MKMKKFMVLGAAAIALQVGLNHAHASEVDFPQEQTAEQKAQAEANATKMKEMWGSFVKKVEPVTGAAVQGVKTVGGTVVQGVKTVGEKIQAQNHPEAQPQAPARTKEQIKKAYAVDDTSADVQVQSQPKAKNTNYNNGKGVAIQPPAQEAPSANLLGNSAAAKQLGNNVETFKGHLGNILNKFRSNEPASEQTNKMSPN